MEPMVTIWSGIIIIIVCYIDATIVSDHWTKVTRCSYEQGVVTFL